jgi:pre-mRNA-splicing factor CWC22
MKALLEDLKNSDKNSLEH